MLRQLFRRATKNTALDRCVKDLLGEPLRSHVRVAVIRDDTLILSANSPAWAARLRYQVRELRAAIAHDKTIFPEIRTILVRVAKSGAEPPGRDHHAPRGLSPGAAATLREHAASLDDPALRDALLRLAQHRRA